MLFVPNLIIPLPIEALLTAEVYVILLHISARNETASESSLKLIIKMYLIST
jgi:hypothetical protein